MDGTKQARINRCHTCPHRCTRHANFWAWPHCTHGGGDLELSDEFMETGECPAGYWSGLTPVNMEAEAAAQEQRRLEYQRENVKPALKVLLDKYSERAQKETVLLTAVGLGAIDIVLAEEIGREEGLDLDAEPQTTIE